MVDVLPEGITETPTELHHMNIPNINGDTVRRFENHISYARQEGAKLYESTAPDVIVEGDDTNEEDQALLAAGLLLRDDGYYTFSQRGWEYARYLNS
jgi:hypothetical protein